MGSAARLLAPDFPTVSYDEWRRRVEEELGGTPFDEALATELPEGLRLQPLYTERDAGGDDPAGFPGLPPYVRGSRALGRGWAVAQEYRRAAELDLLAADLDAGVTSVRIHAGSAVPDPIATPEPFLARVDLARIAVTTAGFDDASTPLVAEAARQGVARSELRGGYGCDPLAALARGDELSPSVDAAFERAADLAAWSRRETPGMRALLIDLAPHHEAGASAVAELALLAASAAEVLRRLAEDGVDEAAGQTTIALSVGGDFFLEIAKLRAARLLWAKVVAASGGSPEAQKAWLHARTSRVRRSAEDPWSNLLRGTAETFAAAVGGADSIATAPYDEPTGSASPAGRRLAVNTQHILREEASLDRVADPAGGSYCVEKLTEELARAAWSLFREIERRGGMAECLAEGWIRERIAATAEQRRGAE